MSDARQRDSRHRAKDGVYVVGHDRPCVQHVTLAVEESHRFLNDVCCTRIAQVTAAVATVQKSINETVCESASRDSPGQTSRERIEQPERDKVRSSIGRPVRKTPPHSDAHAPLCSLQLRLPPRLPRTRLLQQSPRLQGRLFLPGVGRPSRPPLFLGESLTSQCRGTGWRPGRPPYTKAQSTRGGYTTTRMLLSGHFFRCTHRDDGFILHTDAPHLFTARMVALPASQQRWAVVRPFQKSVINF